MSDIAHTSLTRSQIVDEILRLNDVEERQAAEIDRLRERCDAYKGQVWAGEQEIERLRKAIEYACHSLDLGRITSTVASELRAAVGQLAAKDEK